MEVQTTSELQLGDTLAKGQLSSWLDDMGTLLNIDVDVSSLDLQSVPTKSPEDYFCMSEDSPLSSPFPPYSSPDLPEIERSFIGIDAPPLFDEQLIEVDAMFFTETSFTVNPEVLPELEKILSAVDSSIFSPPTSPSSPQEGLVPNATRVSKKRKGDDGKDCNTSSICLPRDQLLTMTSIEIEEYVTKLKSQRNLTASEEKELKRQRRLIKNREYASQSRSRKKQYVDELEKTLENVRTENSSLKQQVTMLSDENKTLKKHISAIAATIKKSTSLSSSSSALTSTFTKLTSVGGRSSNNAKTVSACLLAIMFMGFTFGVFWDNQPNQVYPINQQRLHFTTRMIHGIEDPAVQFYLPSIGFEGRPTIASPISTRPAISTIVSTTHTFSSCATTSSNNASYLGTTQYTLFNSEYAEHTSVCA